MKLKHHNIEIPVSDPFANCELDRKKYALVLTDIVHTYADGFVLSINNEWGTGKTTFVRMWQQHLNNEGFQTIYFNAWENDFDSDPLVAIMSELKTLTNNKNEKLFKSVVSKGAVLVKNVAPAMVKAIIKNYIDTDKIVDAVENTTKGATEILEEEMKAYATKKKTVESFRAELENFITKTESNKPLIFIIDELDRCRPTYAVEVLEQMKHFFSVPGIVFVLSIDKNHLACSIKGVYGSEHINTEEYLRRFVDIEYSIPQPSVKKFCEYLFEYYDFVDFFVSDKRKNISAFLQDGKFFLRMATHLLIKTNATLRQQEKIFAHTRLAIKSFKSNSYVFSELFFILTFIKVMNPELFKKIENTNLEVQDLSDAYLDLVNSIDTKEAGLNLVHIEALLLQFYNNSRKFNDKISLYKTEDNGQLTTPIKNKYNKEYKRGDLAISFQDIERQPYYGDLKLSYLINKISLIDPVANE